MDERISLSELTRVSQGNLIAAKDPHKTFIFPSQICTDSRKIRKGDLFVALKGENFDGHNFVKESAAKSGIGAIISRKVNFPLTDFFLLEVDNTLRALQDIAGFHRKKLSLTTIAVTGSNGKTTVKEMIAHLLSSHYVVAQSPGNFNNQIGVSLSLLALNYTHKVAVLEMGMNRRGEILDLSRIIQPRIGIITNIQHAHIGLLGSRREIMEAKSELVSILNEDSENWLILNQDCPWTYRVKKKARCRILTFGMRNLAQIRAEKVTNYGQRTSFTLTYPDGQSYHIGLPFPGRFNIYNALAAASVAYLLGISAADVSQSLSQFKLPALHIQIEEIAERILINDSYNANPDSMEEALIVLAKFGKRRKIAILGDMLELEEKSTFFHRKIGKKAAVLGIDVLFSLGRFSEDMTRGAQEGGMKQVFSFRERDILVKKLSSFSRKSDCLLIKGSREMRMEEIFEKLKVNLCSIS